MNVKIKKLVPEAVIPSYAHTTDAGMDLIAVRKWTDNYGNICYGTGLAFEIPEGYAGFIYPRSSVSKYTLSLCNSTGIIDCGYRGEVIFKFKPTLVVGGLSDEEPYDKEWNLDDDDTVVAIAGKNPYINSEVLFYSNDVYDIGDKIGQIIIMHCPHIEFEESDELSDTDRGEGGFGSSGK